MLNYNSCYIHLPQGYISHVGINLLTGFVQGGLRVFSNFDASLELGSPHALMTELLARIEHRLFPDDIDFCVIDVTRGTGDIQEINTYILGKKAVVLTMSDGSNYTAGVFSKSIMTFSAHCNRFARHKGAIFPLGFGVTNKLIEISNQYDLTEKKLKIIKNFNPTFRQEIRASLELTLVENLAHYFTIDTRHTSGNEYWKHLSESVAVLAYCGEYYADVRQYDYMRDVVIKDRQELFDFEVFDCDVAIFRWDSYRFWEAALFGCAPFQLHFEKYGMELPVMPIPWVHYIPIDLASVSLLPEKIAEMLRNDPLALHKIGKNARTWVLENYSPLAVATHLLATADNAWP